MKTLFYTVMIAALLSGCKEETVNASYSQADTIAVTEDAYLPEPPAPVAADSYDISEAKSYSDKSIDPSEQTQENFEPKIIKNARLRFQADDLDTTAKTVQELVKKYNGNIQSDLQEHEDYMFSRSMSVNIPSAGFEAFIADLGKGVENYDLKEISSQDVTEEYVDIAARIRTKKQLENRYYELLKKANKVSEMLEIEQKLSEIREEVEAKEGRLKYLQTKVSMSAVNISFYKEIARGTLKSQSYGSKLWASLGTGFNSLSSFFLAVLDNWPFILIFVIAIVLIRKRIKRKRKQNV